jgi:Tetratricopeptide repeat
VHDIEQARVLGPILEDVRGVRLLLYVGRFESVRGRYADARAVETQALNLARRVLGEEHPDTLRSMNNLAGILKAQGNLSGARALQERVLPIYRRLLGEEHPDTSVSAWNLFRTLQDLGDSELAIATRRNHLLWLLGRDPLTLGYVQNRIRDYLIQLRDQGRDTT